MPFVLVDKHRVFYEASSDVASARESGEIVLLVHGAYDDHRYWKKVRPALDRGHAVIAVDLPAHGASDGPALRDAASYQRFFEGLAAALGLTRFVFCGHSMGGSMAIQYALAHKDRLASLILVGSAPSWSISQDDIDLWDRNPDQAFRGNLEYLFASGTPAAVREDYDRQMRATAPATCKADLETCRSFDLEERLVGISVLALVVRGDQEYWSMGSDVLAARISGAIGETIADAGHAIALERPEQLAEAVNRFLKLTRVDTKEG